MSKKMVCAFLAIAFVVLLAAMSAGAEESTDASEQWTYVLRDGGATITGFAEEPTGDLVIPGELDGYPVTGIGNPDFYRYSGLISVIIPDSVTSPGHALFAGCNSLTGVTLPDSMTSIGDRMFATCSNLTSVTIPACVTSIGEGAFTKSGLTSVTIPHGVTSIGGFAFDKCSNLTSVTIPAGVKKIGKRTFAKCISLTSVTIPDGVTSIGESAFRECNGLTSVTIPEGVKDIGYMAFAFSGLTNVIIPQSVTEIGEDAFLKCEELILTVQEGSYAEQYAKENGIRYVLTPDATAETADTLLVKQIDEFFAMTREEILEKLGSDFTVVPAGPEGVCDGYYYEDLGMAFAFYPDNDTLELIDCYPNFKIHGVGTGSLFSEILEALGDTEIVETWLELPIYTAFMVRYRLGKGKQQTPHRAVSPSHGAQ